MIQVDYQIRFPEEISDLRNQEYFFVIQNGNESKYTLPKYGEVFNVPLLYEV